MKKLIAALLVFHVCNSGAMAQFYCQPPPPQIIYCHPQQYRPQQTRIPNVSESRTYQPTAAATKSSTFEPSTTVPKAVTTKPAAPRFETDDADTAAKPSSFMPMTDDYKEEIMKEIRSLRNEMKEFRERLDRLEKGKSKDKDDVGYRVRHKSTW